MHAAPQHVLTVFPAAAAAAAADIRSIPHAVCSILPSDSDVSCLWSDTSGTNALREAQLTVMADTAGTCTLSLLALAGGDIASDSAVITVFKPTCDSFLSDGTAWSKAPGNACPAGTKPVTDTGVVNPGPTTCCTSQGDGTLSVSVTLPPPGFRPEFKDFLFIYNVSYPVGPGPASAKQVQLENTLPSLLTPASTVAVSGASECSMHAGCHHTVQCTAWLLHEAAS
jgi:hypothetical protein